MGMHSFRPNLSHNGGGWCCTQVIMYWYGRTHVANRSKWDEMIFPVLTNNLFRHRCLPPLLCVASCICSSHVVLSPQLLYPSDSRQCVLRPPTWHSSQRPQGVCVSLCLCVYSSAFHFSAFVLTLRAMVALHMLMLICVADLPVPAICPSICLSLFFLPRLSARLQALHLGLFLHYFGWSEAETRVLADIILKCLWELIKSGVTDISGQIPQ